jgi:phosphopantothenoylcysteine decarboxylase/phosphopantothenate--cysteine ligase
VSKLSQQKRPAQILVGFAAQTGEIIAPAQEKLSRKQLDIIVANPVDRADAGFGSETNQAVMIHRNGDQITIAPCQKLELAHRLLDFIGQHSS